MTRLICISLLLICYLQSVGQDPDEMHSANQWEGIAASSDQEPENDYNQQALQYLLRHPVNINKVDPDQLVDLQLITLQQANALKLYREIFGNIRIAYELQAIPSWDINTIRKLLPLLSFEDIGTESRVSGKMFSAGQHQILIRTSSVIEKSIGFSADSAGNRKYAGNPIRLFYRYTYQFKQQLWWGFTGDKDAGERWNDFNSFHVFYRGKSWLKTIALGDYTINIGQGLIQWQGLAFGKTSEAMNIFHQGNLLQPYRSGGEWNFNRGIATQIQYKKLELTIFGSSKKQTANLVSDSIVTAFTSINESGYHRTSGELTDRNSITQKSYGAVIQYSIDRLRLGVSVIQYKFSKPAIPAINPYNLYAMRGSNWFNSGIHYSYNARKFFVFGEAAYCKTGYAVLQGLVMSIHHNADLSLVYRNIDPGYQALYGQGFTENSTVTNERGIYTALRISPWPGWTIQAYVDYFRFPWLRFRADAPGSGQEYFLQLGWVKRKKWEISLRYRSNNKPENKADEYVNQPQTRMLSNIRLHVERVLSMKFLMSARVDKVWYYKGNDRQEGLSVFLDTRYQFSKPAFVISARAQYFNTGGYESRIYAYERDLLYSFSIPAFYDKGVRYYCQVQGKPARLGNHLHLKLQWWIRWSQSHYGKGHVIGSGTDEIMGNKKSEWKMQVMLTL